MALAGGCSDADGARSADPACSACAVLQRTCATSPGTIEAASLDVTSRGVDGCTVVLDGDPPATIHCEPLEICRGESCTPVEERDGTLVFANGPGTALVTCVP